MADLNPDLLKQAEELNIVVTENATNEALQAAIDEVLAEDGAGAATSDIAATGKNAFNGWDAAELQKRIGAASTAPSVVETDKPDVPETTGFAKARVHPLDHDGDGRKGGAAPALHQMRVNRDFWDNAGERHRKGTIVEVSVESAMDGLESGALSRVR